MESNRCSIRTRTPFTPRRRPAKPSSGPETPPQIPQRPLKKPLNACNHDCGQLSPIKTSLGTVKATSNPQQHDPSSSVLPSWLETPHLLTDEHTPLRRPRATVETVQLQTGPLPPKTREIDCSIQPGNRRVGHLNNSAEQTTVLHIQLNPWISSWKRRPVLSTPSAILRGQLIMHPAAPQYAA